jgi:hypothetical protein
MALESEVLGVLLEVACYIVLMVPVTASCNGSQLCIIFIVTFNTSMTINVLASFPVLCHSEVDTKLLGTLLVLRRKLGKRRLMSL